LIIPSPWGLTFSIFALTVFRTVLTAVSDQEINTVQFQVKTALTGLIYEKALKISYKSSLELSEARSFKGRILQMVTVDVYNVFNCVWRSFETLLTLIQIVAIDFLLNYMMGYVVTSAAIALGLAILLILCLLPSLEKYQDLVLKYGDERIRMIREALMGMKIIKLRAADYYFQNVVNTIRHTQMKYLALFLAILGLLVLVLTVIPIGLPIFLLSSYRRLNLRLQASTIFPALSYFRMLYTPLRLLPQDTMTIIQGVTSWIRIRQFLAAEEIQMTVERTRDPNSSLAIDIRNSSFVWETAEPVAGGRNGESLVIPVFENLDLQIRKGHLVAIVGSVGSGKSSLMSALTSEMAQTSGSTKIDGKIALCQQQPWLMSKTIQENILFGLPLVPAKLAATIRACGLETDIQQLENGLQTVVGDNSITLSGGQRARVALARAVYYNADIYLLDDPLAALDSRAGKFVFDECINGILRSKTRLLVTHQLQYLPMADEIIVLHEGKIVEQGTFTDLMMASGQLSRMMKDLNFQPDDANTSMIEPVLEDPGAAARKKYKHHDDEPVDCLIADEDRERGMVQWGVIIEYARQSGGLFLTFIMFSLFALYMLADVTGGLWLTWWSEDRYSAWSNGKYFRIYLGLTVGGLGAVGMYFSFHTQIFDIINIPAVSVVILFYQNIRASRSFHEGAIKGLFNAPMSFFDSQPIGRILNRLSKDLHDLDNNLWYHSLNTYLQMARTVGVIILVGYIAPLTLIIFTLLGFAYYWIMNLYRASIRELKRLRSVHMSPLSAHISESLSGLTTLRGFKAEGRCVKVQRRLIDEANIPAFIQENAAIWLGFRIGIFASLLILGLCIIGILSDSAANSVGFAITVVMSFSEYVRSLIFSFALLEAAMVAVERLNHYCQELPTEAPRHMDTDPGPNRWPERGEIEIRQLVARYESREKPALKDVSMRIRRGEKIGIVGRTGSGKSTLLTMLFRLVEPHSGSIWIDGVDICKIGLHTLRSRLEIISQEPVLFSGTLRSNLDIDRKYDDAKIWEALSLVGMKEFVSKLPNKLDAPVSSNGENFSVGQRQLLTLARAICANPRVLIMDEASSAIDATADQLLQKAIRTQFHSTTVLSIAHRLNTVADFDRVAVLDGGELVEFDAPYRLLRRRGGVGAFRQLVEATGKANAEALEKMAREYYQQTGGEPLE
ncbi:P-loop containing nucleoside triphosphate hydrolase protein, partial [Zopfochytrium polystomum]